MYTGTSSVANLERYRQSLVLIEHDRQSLSLASQPNAGGGRLRTFHENVLLGWYGDVVRTQGRAQTCERLPRRVALADEEDLGLVVDHAPEWLSGGCRTWHSAGKGH